MMSGMIVSPSTGWLRHRSFLAFALAALAGSTAIAAGSLWASRRAGETEAMADVRALTSVVAQTVVGPSLTAELLAGDPDALARLDVIVEQRVLDDMTLRVKLWAADGTIVYSDEHRLIGEVYELEDDKIESLWSGDVVSEISAVDGPENRFEAELADRMLEVYLPIDGPAGSPLLYESYFAVSPVNESATRIRSEFLPAIIVPLGLMLALHLTLAWALSQRLQHNQADRERLLRRAIESSDLERRRIAADLHDGVVQDLTGTSFALAAAAETAKAAEPELGRDLRVAAASTRRSLQSLRTLLVDIYPPNLHEHGLEAALIDLLAPAGGLGIETDLTIRGPIDDWPTGRTALVYRVIQESVRNIYRHAAASKLEIAVDVNSGAGTTEVTVTDDGVGLAEPRSDNHFGLRLLSDLAADAGARFSVDSQPGIGTTVRLEVGS